MEEEWSDIMELTFTGRGAAFNIKEGNTNAYFIENDILFLIDCGETMFRYVMQHNLLKGINKVYALVSHTHSDHCGSLGSFGLYCQYALAERLKIIVPHHDEYIEQLRTLMTLFGNTDKAYEFVYEEEIDYMFKNFNKVRYDFTLHAYELICFSFIFETDKGDVFFSADTRTADNLLKFVDSHKNIDKIFMEVTDSNHPNDIHFNLAKLDTLIPENIKPYIYMMHFRNDECMQKVADLGYKIVEVNVNIC